MYHGWCVWCIHSRYPMKEKLRKNAVFVTLSPVSTPPCHCGWVFFLFVFPFLLLAGHEQELLPTTTNILRAPFFFSSPHKADFLSYASKRELKFNVISGLEFFLSKSFAQRLILHNNNNFSFLPYSIRWRQRAIVIHKKIRGGAEGEKSDLEEANGDCRLRWIRVTSLSLPQSAFVLSLIHKNEKWILIPPLALLLGCTLRIRKRLWRETSATASQQWNKEIVKKYSHRRNEEERLRFFFSRLLLKTAALREIAKLFPSCFIFIIIGQFAFFLLWFDMGKASFHFHLTFFLCFIFFSLPSWRTKRRWRNEKKNLQNSRRFVQQKMSFAMYKSRVFDEKRLNCPAREEERNAVVLLFSSI